MDKKTQKSLPKIYLLYYCVKIATKFFFKFNIFSTSYYFNFYGFTRISGCYFAVAAILATINNFCFDIFAVINYLKSYGSSF